MAGRKKVTIRGQQYYRTQITCPDGKRKSLYGKTIAEVREKERKFREDLNAKRTNAGITVGEYAKLQLDFIAKQVDPRTYTGYEAKVRLYIIPLIGDKQLLDVTSDDIQAVLTNLSPLSQSYYRTVHMLLRRIFKAAKKNRLIVDDPTEDIDGCGGQKKKERPALTDTEVEVLLKAVKGLRVETFCRIGIYAGLRREEILGLKWQHVFLDVEHPYIEVKNAWRVSHNRPNVSSKLKSDAARRTIPIPPQLSDYLQVEKMAATSEYVVCNSAGGPLSETQWRNLWSQVSRRTIITRKYVRYSGGKKAEHWVTPRLGAQASHNPEVIYSMDFAVTPHQLRYTYVTNLIHKGLDPKTVQYLAGHESIKITMEIYARLKYNRPDDLAGPICKAFEDHEK